MCFMSVRSNCPAPMGSAIRADTAEEESSGEKRARSGGKAASSRFHTRPELEGSHFTRVGFFTSGFSRGHGQTNVSAPFPSIFPTTLASPCSLQPTFHTRWRRSQHSKGAPTARGSLHIPPPLPHLGFTNAVRPASLSSSPEAGIRERPHTAATQAWDPTATAGMPPACAINRQLPYPLRLTVLWVLRKRRTKL